MSQHPLHEYRRYPYDNTWIGGLHYVDDDRSGTVHERGWYESADLWSPALFRRLAMPPLREVIQATKAAGAAFVYLMDSGVVPLLPDLSDLDFDCLAGIDPATAGGTDLAGIRRVLPDKAIGGGISGPLHLGQGTPEQVEQAVKQAFAACGHTGFILGPAVGFRHGWPWANLMACDHAWRRCRDARSKKSFPCSHHVKEAGTKRITKTDPWSVHQ